MKSNPSPSATLNLCAPVGVTGTTLPASRMLTLDFAYPSSDSAKRFGFNDAGCYVVGMFDGVNPSKDKRGFATKSEAIAYGNAMGIAWHPLWIVHHPELAPSPASPVKDTPADNAPDVMWSTAFPGAIPASPVESVGVAESMFHFMERSVKRCADPIDHDGELYGVIQCPEFALDVYAPVAMEMEAFKSTLRAFTGNAASHAAKDAKIRALTESLKEILETAQCAAGLSESDAHEMLRIDRGNGVFDRAEAALALHCASLGS